MTTSNVLRCWAFLIIILCLQIGNGKSSKFINKDDNDDDYLSQKEHILEKSYHGLIRENETFVEITPLIKIDEEKICDFRILKKSHHEIPFQIELVNNLGILKARRTLNCEKRRSYHFEIIAIFCDGSHSATANVHISVIDINEYAPTFVQPSYVTEVDEGRLYQEIIRVEANDKDCTPPYGDVCKYEILNNDQPFQIDNEGSIKNIEALSHKISHNHILSVVAYDCAMKQSAPIMVSIKVRRVCEARLAGIPERIDYTATISDSVSLFPNIRLELCDFHCNYDDINIHASVALKTKHISFGCDRDITKCFHGHKLIDLLPKNVEWTKDLNYDEGLETIYHFDGTSGAIIPNNYVAQHDFGTNKFSIITMFRHFSYPTSNKHAKEHIICSADDHKMNRHHMALFVRNCRLILLLRKNFNDGDLNIFSPAEWRWKIPHVCDNEWHHYVLNINLPKIQLFIDGNEFNNNNNNLLNDDHHSNPEVIDDWPLHAAHGVNTTLAIGSCYQGSENHLKHNFNGDISEIKLLFNNVMSIDDIKCGTNCAEHLLPPNEKYLQSEQEVQSNIQLNEIYIDGNNKTNIELLLQKIQYVNTKKYPTIGRRNIELRTTLKCLNQNTIRLPTVETYIMVNQQQQQQQQLQQQQQQQLPSLNNNKKMHKIQSSKSPILTLINNKNDANNDDNNDNDNDDGNNDNDDDKPKIYINGNSNHLVSYPDIKNGVRILENINITVLINNELQNNLQILDGCSVSVFPSLNPDHEEIALDGDETLSTTLDIKTNINKDGVEMIGYDIIKNYLDILKSLVYTNKKPAYYLNRVFKLTCSQINLHFQSAEYTLTLTVLHPKQTVLTTTTTTSTTLITPLTISSSSSYNSGNGGGGSGQQLQHDSNMFAHAMVHSHDVQEPKSRVHSIVHKAQSSHPTMLIIVICVFFVLLLCGVSIARLRNSNHKYMERHQPCPKITAEQLDWDDSALTITINPMQNGVVSEDSSDSDNSESEDDEVVNGKYKNVSQLEWDNSTM